MSQVATLDDRSRRRPVVVMSWQSSARYCDNRPFSALYTRTAILNSMRCRTGSKWSRLNAGVMCSDRRVPLTRCAAAFLTTWRRWTRLSVTLSVAVYRLLQSELELTSSRRHQQYATWALPLTVMSPCRLMCQRLYRRVLQSCDSSDPSGARCPKSCLIRWSYRWLCHASTTATRHSQGFLPTSTNVCSRSSMLPPDWFIVRLDTTTSRRYCATCTG